MNLYKDTCLLYETLYKQCTQNAKFKYTPNLNDKHLILKFVSWLVKNYQRSQITDSLLIQFFEFQFSHYRGVVTPNGRNSIMLNWVIGNKALDRWQNRNISNNKIIVWRVHVDGVKLSVFKPKRPHKALLFRFLKQINPLEEQEKERFLNKKVGYLHCRNMTTLYNPKSEICSKRCAYKEYCIKRLKQNFEKLYKLRMENV